jgi:hypothetical protein
MRARMCSDARQKVLGEPSPREMSRIWCWSFNEKVFLIHWSTSGAVRGLSLKHSRVVEMLLIKESVMAGEEVLGSTKRRRRALNRNIVELEKIYGLVERFRVGYGHCSKPMNHVIFLLCSTTAKIDFELAYDVVDALQSTINIELLCDY